MSKSVMFAIKPKYCELIKKRMKTAEVRKRIPRLTTPYKCYIYQTGNGGVIGEFICDYITCSHRERRDGKLIKWDELIKNEAMAESCLDSDEYEMYAPTHKNLYTLHISDLVIYDKPKDLCEFYKACNKADFYDCSRCEDKGEKVCYALECPPQSWCYVEEQELF